MLLIPPAQPLSHNVRGTLDQDQYADHPSGLRIPRRSESAMITFQFSLVSPERLLFSGQVEQVDLPGSEGDFGVLAGHAPIVATLRPGMVTAIAGSDRDRFVVLGGLAEFSQSELTILADSATPADEFDLAEFKARIDEMQENLRKNSAGDELDRAVALLDHYKSIHTSLVPATAF
jgi:F-type H+-transporting ATPase subunit epsilon